MKKLIVKVLTTVFLLFALVSTAACTSEAAGPNSLEYCQAVTQVAANFQAWKNDGIPREVATAFVEQAIKDAGDTLKAEDAATIRATLEAVYDGVELQTIFDRCRTSGI